MLKLTLFGLVTGPFIGFLVGAVLTGIAMLAGGISDQLSPTELQEIIPWTIVFSIVFAVLSAPVGAISGAIFALAPLLSTAAKVGISAVIGLLVAGIVLPQFLNAGTDGVVLVIATAIFVASSAILGRAIAALQNWRRRPEPVTAGP